MNSINNEIKSSKIKVVTDEGLQLLTLEEGLLLADELGLDLVEVSKVGDISICKCLDYSKYLYQQKKKEKSQPKKDSLKIIKLGCMIADHDLSIKANSVERLINQGNKVKVVILLKGYRGKDSLNVSLDIYNKLMVMLKDKVEILKDIQVEGRTGTFTVKGK